MLKCPKCGSENGHVVDSRPSENNTARRRRECNNCGFRFSTIEITIQEYKTMKKGKIK